MDAESINILILPSKEIQEKAIELSKIVANTVPTEFILDTENYRPHISIYQGHYPKKNIQKLFEIVENIASRTKTFSIELEDFKYVVHTFLFWNCIKNAQLQDLHETILEKCFSLREGLIPPNLQALLPQLSDEEKERVDRTGGLLTENFFDPHITITRIKNVDDQEKAMRVLQGTSKTTFVPENIVIGKLGDHGTLPEVLKEFTFKQ